MTGRRYEHLGCRRTTAGRPRWPRRCRAVPGLWRRPPPNASHRVAFRLSRHVHVAERLDVVDHFHLIMFANVVAIDAGQKGGRVIVEFHGFHNDATSSRMHITLSR